MQGNGLQVPPSSSARGEAGAAVLVEGVGVIAAWQGRLRLLAPQTSSPGDLMLVWGGAGAEVRGWRRERIALALRDFEREMCQRTGRVVALSHASAKTLHQPAYAEPAYHVRRNRRNGQDPARLGALRAARVTAAAADVSPDLLELLAFGPGPDHNLQNALLDGGPKARLHPTES